MSCCFGKTLRTSFDNAFSRMTGIVYSFAHIPVQMKG